MRKPSKRRNSEAGLGSPQYIQPKNVRIDAPSTEALDSGLAAVHGASAALAFQHVPLGKLRQKRRKRPLLSSEDRSAVAHAAQIARIPVEPHPDNLKLVGPPPEHYWGFPTLEEWLAAHIREGQARAAQSNVSFWSWVGCEAFYERLAKLLEDCARFDDMPLSPRTVRIMRQLKEAMGDDLGKTRPF